MGSVDGSMVDVAVVGAGICGLTAARVVAAANCGVVVFDKGRGVGGRMATRRIGSATFDHGAQFITAKSAEMVRTVAGWEADGLAAHWFDGSPDMDRPSLGDAGRPATSGAAVESDAHPRFRGAPAMTGIAKGLARGLEVRLGTRITRISSVDRSPTGAGLVVRSSDGDEAIARRLILTAPGPQITELLEASDVSVDPAARATVSALAYDPCVAVMVVCAGPSRLGSTGAARFASGAVEWVADNRIKGVSDAHAVTIHLAPEASRELIDEPHAGFDVAMETVGHLIGEPVEHQVHLWRYATPRQPVAERVLVLDAEGTIAAAGDAFGGPRVEGAALSGRAAGRWATRGERVGLP